MRVGLKQNGASTSLCHLKRVGSAEALTSYRFKLHLRSRLGPGAGTEMTDKIPPLPPGKTVVEVFADFLVYLLGCASKYIQETHASGVALWDSVKGQIEFVLSHPNGWEGIQQKKLRRAAVYAGLIPDNDKGQERIHFVTEGEASLHFCIDRGLSSFIKVSISSFLPYSL